MVYKKGDRVKFLNDVGGGIIVRTEGKLIYVENQDGFEIPVSASEILPDPDGDFSMDKSSESGDRFNSDKKSLVQKPIKNWGTPSEKQENTTNKTYNTSESKDEIYSFTGEFDPSLKANKGFEANESPLYIAWVSDFDEKKSRLYILNDGVYSLFYTVSVVKNGGVQLLKAGYLEDGYKETICVLDKNLITEADSIRFEGIVFKTGFYIPHKPFCFESPVKYSDIFNQAFHTSNDFFDEKAWVIPVKNAAVETENPAKLLKEHIEKGGGMAANSMVGNDYTGASPVAAQKSNNNIGTDEPEIVDLHIELLIENSNTLSSTEILDIQMARFKISLDSAISRKTKRMIYIHGVGNGKLRYNIRKALENDYPKLKFQDASFKEYGYGATMVFIR